MHVFSSAVGSIKRRPRNLGGGVLWWMVKGGSSYWC